MRASVAWLRELTGVDASAQDIAEKLTSLGFEVEETERFGALAASSRLVELRGAKSHPARKKLRVVTVFDGSKEFELVCGAPQLPPTGSLVAWVMPGALLPNGEKLEAKNIGGVESPGMLGSEAELGLGEDESGLFVAAAAPTGELGDFVPGAELEGLCTAEDTILDIGITPNRPDGLGHIGLAREVALGFGKTFDPKKVPVLPSILGRALTSDKASSLPEQDPSFEICIEDGERCPAYGAAVLQGAKVASSPLWLRALLYRLGIRPINNLVDATNYILLKWGHPTHAFDAKKLQGERITVRVSSPKEVLRTLDGQDRVLDEDLVIADTDGPIALAGIMGGEGSEIADATTEVVLECAYFDGRGIRRSSRKQGLQTDASYRFERGVDPYGLRNALAELAYVCDYLSGSSALAARVVETAELPVRKVVPFRVSRASELLGAPVDASQCRNVFEALGMQTSDAETQAQTLAVTIPGFRPDISREADLIEEYGRVYGLDSIEPTLPRILPTETSAFSESGALRSLRERCAGFGFSEAVNYAFLSSELLTAYHTDGSTTDAIRIVNPLSEDGSLLRPSLLPGLSHCALRSHRHQVDRVALFEVGRVFHSPSNDTSQIGTQARSSGDETLPLQPRRFALWWSGIRGVGLGKDIPVDFYDMKGSVSDILFALFRRRPSFVADSAHPWNAAFHPKKRAAIRLGDSELGQMGELDPRVARALELPGSASCAELDLEVLLQCLKDWPVHAAVAPPRFPPVVRDVAMLVAEEVRVGDLCEVLREGAEGLAESVSLFDLYRGSQIPKGQKSLAFRVIYRDSGRTLSDKEVDRAHHRATQLATSRFHVTLR